MILFSTTGFTSNIYLTFIDFSTAFWVNPLISFGIITAVHFPASFSSTPLISMTHLFLLGTSYQNKTKQRFFRRYFLPCTIVHHILFCFHNSSFCPPEKSVPMVTFLEKLSNLKYFSTPLIFDFLPQGAWFYCVRFGDLES